MSFRQFGGLQYAARHNAVSSNYNTSNNLLVTQNVGQPNSYINFQSDISGNISVYGDFDLSGNFNVSGDIDVSGNINVTHDIDISGNINVGGDIDVSGNINVGGDIDVSGNINVTQDIDCSGNITASKMYLTGLEQDYFDNEVVPKAYVDSVASGLTPLPSCYLCSNEGPIDLSGNTQTIDSVTLNSLNNGYAILVNAQGGAGVADIDNGIYIVSDGIWDRASYLASGAVATGTATYITTGVNYGGYTFVGTSGTKTTPAIIDASAVLWSQFGYQVQYGQGLYKSVVDGSPVVSVDSSLNFIQYLDNTAGPNSGTMYIGTNTNTVNIGKTNTVISGNVGIGKTPGFTLDVSGNCNINAGSSQTSPPALNIIKDTGTAELFGVWQHNAQLQIQNFNNNSLVLAMSTDASAIIQGKTVNGPYNNLLINPLGGDVSVGSTIDTIDFTVNGNLNVTGSITNNTIITLLGAIYPVGSIYMNYDSSSNPSTILNWSGSTWVEIPGGTTIAALYTATSGGDNYFSVIGATGGNASIQSHNHQCFSTNNGTGVAVNTETTDYDAIIGFNSSGGGKYYDSNDNKHLSGGSFYTSNTVNNADAHSNYSPYLVVSMWRRTG